MDKSVQVLILLLICSLGASSSPTYGKERGHAHRGCDEAAKQLAIVSRVDWGARPPKHTAPMKNPVPYVIIHHTAVPPACHSEDECVGAMKSMQDFHMDDRGWDDLGYNFAIGGDGRIYMGRGWTNSGAHAPTYNNVSIGITLIGDWTAEVPPKSMTDRAHELINFGVHQGHIRKDYEMYGHRQVRDTECPGDAFYEALRTWPHWGAHPPRKITTTTTEATTVQQ